jgi:hypothetical protein
MHPRKKTRGWESLLGGGLRKDSRPLFFPRVPPGPAQRRRAPITGARLPESRFLQETGFLSCFSLWPDLALNTIVASTWNRARADAISL